MISKKILNAISNVIETSEAMKTALKNQGLEYKDGKIVSITESDNNPCDNCKLKTIYCTANCTAYRDFLNKIYTEQSDGLTDFEKELSEMLYSYRNHLPNEARKLAKEHSNCLEHIIRKQIVSEIDIEDMVKVAELQLIPKTPNFYSDIQKDLLASNLAALYRKGIEDIIKKIKQI